MYTLKEFPTTEDFVYLKCRNQNPSEYKPYALEVVQFADVSPANYYTMSVRGLTHYMDGLNADFTSELQQGSLHAVCKPLPGQHMSHML
jgi:dynein heavy chain